MKIATYNLEFLFDEGLHNHSGQEWNYTRDLVAARIDYFANIFSEINADVLLLQEVASESVLQRIIKKTGIDYAYFIAAPDQYGVANATLYKRKDAIYNSVLTNASLPVFVTGDADTTGARLWSRRSFVHLETSWENKQIHIIGIHIKANFLMPEKNSSGEAGDMITQITAADGLIRSEMFRLSQAKKVRELIDSIFNDDPDAFIIVGGDYNAEEYSSVYRVIQGTINDSFDTLVPTSSGYEEANRFSTLSASTKRKRLIDHILISKSLEKHLLNIQILNDKIDDNKNIAPKPTKVGSDHAPVVIELGD